MCPHVSSQARVHTCFISQDGHRSAKKKNRERDREQVEFLKPPLQIDLSCALKYLCHRIVLKAVINPQPFSGQKPPVCAGPYDVETLDFSEFKFIHASIYTLKYCKIRYGLALWYSSFICGKICQLDATDDFYCRSYCLLNMFRGPLCPSSGAGEYYTSGCCLSYLVLGFQVVGMMWSWGLCVRFAGSCP